MQKAKKIQKKYLIRGIRYLKNHNLKSLFLKTSERLYRDRVEQGYDEWVKARQDKEEALKAQRAYIFENRPKFSILVPTFNTPEKFLREMIESVLNQSYDNVELCIADGSTKEDTQRIIQEYQKKDKKIKYKHLDENRGISENTNEALKLATGDFIGLLDHDDVLELSALFHVMQVLQKHPKADIIYTDEDKMDGETGIFFGPNFKPDFDLELLCTNNYICHFFLVRTEIARRIGGFRKEYDGAQDYDFIFRCVESTMEIYHIPKILYHWRTHNASTAAAPESKMYAYEAGRRAVESHFQRQKQTVQVQTTENYGFFHGRVSGSSRENIKVLRYNEKQRGEDLNRLAETTKAQVLIFVPEQAEFITRDYEEIFSGKCLQHGIGAVGCLQLYRKRVAEAGLVLHPEKIVETYFGGYSKKRSGYLHRLKLGRSVSAVSTVFAIEKDKLRSVDGFVPALSPKAAQIELCLRLLEAGYCNVYTPLVSAWWYQRNPAGMFTEQDMEYVKEYYRHRLKEDRYYNPSCEQEQYEYGLRRNL